MKNPVTFSLLICLIALALPATAEFTGAEDLINELGIRESRLPSREIPGWSRPNKVAILVWGELADSGVASRDWLLEISDGVEIDIVDVTKDDFDISQLANSDVYVGWCMSDAISSMENLRYIHLFSAGIDHCIPALESLDSLPIATNSAKAASETIAEHAIALMLSLTRNLHIHHTAQLKSSWRD